MKEDDAERLVREASARYVAALIESARREGAEKSAAKEHEQACHAHRRAADVVAQAEAALLAACDELAGVNLDGRGDDHAG